MDTLIKYLKFYFDRFFSSKYVVKGKCKKCGRCCREILFIIKDKYITCEKEFEDLKIWQKKYEHFYASGRDETGRLLFTCKSLKDDNTCRDYFFRSLFCRNYPRIKHDFVARGGTTIEGCGYNFGVSKGFKEFISDKKKPLEGGY